MDGASDSEPQAETEEEVWARENPICALMTNIGPKLSPLDLRQVLATKSKKTVLFQGGSDAPPSVVEQVVP